MTFEQVYSSMNSEFLAFPVQMQKKCVIVANSANVGTTVQHRNSSALMLQVKRELGVTERCQEMTVRREW
jgi:hypothetical protein